MGLDYEIHLYFPIEQMQAVLEDVALMTQGIPTEKLDSEICQGFYFPPDDVIYNHWADNPSGLAERTDAKGRIVPGALELQVYEPDWAWAFGHNTKLREDICVFEFRAISSAMSLILEQSPSIHQTFINLLKTHNGICAIFHDTDLVRRDEIVWPEDTSWSEVFKLLTQSP